MESLTRPAHRRKLSNANGVFSFSSKNAYDDVFATPPPAVAAAASSAAKKIKSPVPVEVYGEIFGSSRVSSIPVLDMSTLDKRTGSGDHRSSLKLDYSKIFGGFADEVTAVPYEKLVAEKAKISSSNKVAMNIKESDKDSEHSSEASDQSIDGENQVNMSYHKSSQRSKETPSGTRHVAKLQAIPGFVHFIDETTRLQKTQGERPLPSIITDKGSFTNQEQNNGKKPEIPMVNTILQKKTEDASPILKESFNNGKKTETPIVNTALQKNTEDAKPVPLVKNDMGSFNNGKKTETPIINTVPQKKIEDSTPVPSVKSEVQRTWSFSGNLQEDKKIEMAIPNKLPSAGVNKGKDGSWWGGSGLNGKFFDSGELNMKTQSFKSSPSVKLNDIKGQPNRSKSSSFGSKANVLEKGSDYLSCSSDEELDVNSAAAESAAALRKAIDQAQESIRLAKELMERKKDGFQGFSKHVSKGKGRKKRSDCDTSNVEENSIKEPYERFDDVFKDFKLRNMIPKVQSDEIAQRDTSFDSRKIEVEKHHVFDKQASDKESEVSVDKEKEIEEEFVFMNEESGINVERKEEESEEIVIKDVRNEVDELEGSEEKFQECLDIIDEEILVPPRLEEVETLVEAEKEVNETIHENVEVKDNETCLFVEEEVKVDEETKERSDIDDLVMIHAQNKDQIQEILEENVKDEEIKEKSCTFMEENQNVDVEVVEWEENENKINEGTESLKIESNKSEEYEAEEANNSAFDTFSEETIIHEVQEQNSNENENEKTSEDHEETCYESEKEVEESVKEASELDESEISETCQSFNEDQSCDGNVANEATDLQNDSNIEIQDTYEVHFCDEKVASSTSSEHRWQYEPSEIHLFHEKTASSGSSENNWLEEEIEEGLVQNFGKSREIFEEPEKEKVDDVIKEEDQKEAEKESIPVVSMETYEKIKNIHKEELIGKNVSVEEKDMRDSKQKEAKKMEENKRERIVVERAIREARERAFAETRERAFAEAREKAERAAVEKVSFEVRQRVMEQAREKHGKATKIDKKPPIEAKLKAERAAVERATSEARERALEKALSQKSIADKLSKDNKVLKHSLSASDLEMEGTSTESVQRRKARLERHERIMERAAKALEEKNMRDLRAQKEQAERNRLAESLDADIKRWASGKEGNLRALLSTLQYILGQDSGWQAVSLTEIITTVAVKKAYRKATLYVHPDKLQQRGASIHQKYICEKVFDLLKAAWNRFNSEER